MPNIEFISYKQLSISDKKHIGNATIKIGDIVLTYKVMEGKDGMGFYVVPPSYKEGKDDEYWKTWFDIDSKIKNQEIINIIKTHVQPFLEARMAVAKLPTSAPIKNWVSDEVPF